MSKSQYYQQAKGLINYFNEKNINIRTMGQLKKNQENELSKKFVSKGSTVKFWRSHLTKLENVKKKIKRKRRIEREMKEFEFKKKDKGVFKWRLIYTWSRTINAVKTGQIIVNRVMSWGAIEELAYDNMMREYGGIVSGADNVQFVVQKDETEGGGLIGKMKLKEVKFFKLKDDCEANNFIVEENCVKEGIIKYYKEGGYVGKKAMRALEGVEEWDVDKLIEFLDKFKFCYDIRYKNFKLYKKNTDAEKKILYAYIANSHLYVMNKNDFKEVGKNTDILINNIVCCNVGSIIKEKYTEESIKNISIKADENLNYEFTGCVINGVKYTKNNELVDVFNMFKNIYEQDYLYDDKFKVYTPLMKIAELNKLNSTFIENMGQPKAVYYNCGNIEGDYCIDKNKAYSWALRMLDNVPVIDAECVEEEFDREIKNEYFYFVDHISDDVYGRYVYGWCSGYRIGDVDNVNITKQIKPKLIKNPFRNIIDKMRDYDIDLCKLVCNMFYGVCQRKNKPIVVVDDIIDCNNGYDEGETIKVGNFYAVIKNVDNSDKYKCNMLPLSHFIVDYMVNELFRKIDELGNISAIDIVKLKTDSITYFGDYVEGLKDDDFFGWKNEEVKVDDWKYIDKKEEEKNIIESGLSVDLRKNVLFNCSAGSGKTTMAIKKLIPKLEGSTLIVSSTCKALEEYYNMDGVVVKTMQFFINNQPKFNKMFGRFDNIVCEEIGLFDYDMFDYIYKNIRGKIYGLGDLDQLKPVRGVDKPLANMNIINTLFDVSVKLNENWRNNFSKDDYSRMKRLEYDYDNKIIGKLNKVNICVKNDTKEMINKEIVRGWVDVFGERMQLLSGGIKKKVEMKVKKGGRIICVKNIDKKEIYNSQRFRIVDYDDDEITIKNISSKDVYKLKKEHFNLHFDYGYALTLYKIQGESVNIEDLGIFDWNIIKNDGDYLYTCLSRIKEKLIIKPEEYKYKFYYSRLGMNPIYNIGKSLGLF